MREIKGRRRFRLSNCKTLTCICNLLHVCKCLHVSPLESVAYMYVVVIRFSNETRHFHVPACASSLL